jgi:hypothetical protein
MKEKLARYLRAISLGKYQTTLYNKDGSPFKSSVVGGIITFFLVILVGVFSGSLLSDTFFKKTYTLDMQSQEIRAYYLTSTNKSLLSN